jgi:ATP-dependent helicase/nuclease subunit B
LNSFLNHAAQFLLQQETPLYQQTVILPSRRAAIFLQRELQKALTKPQLAPRFLSIEELILEVTDLQICPRPELYFKTFECLKAQKPDKLRFEDFNRWGKALLQDFNEIDRYLIDPKSIFSYLGDLKRIESWDLEPGEHTQMLTEYLRFWPALAEVYLLLKEKLLAEGKAYQGLAYRLFAEKIASNCATIADTFGHLYFIGFNALNTAEEQAMITLHEKGLAHFYWDVDSYYFQNFEQEAGLFLRQSKLVKKLQKINQFYGEHQSLSQGKREVRSIAVAGTNLQAVVAAQLIAENSALEQEETALILSDEAILPSVLNNIHPAFKSLNLSMGLGLQHSPLAGFFELLLDFPLEAERHRKKNKQGYARYHHKRWSALLSHPVSQQLKKGNTVTLLAAKTKMLQGNLLYPTLQDLHLEDAFYGLESDFFKVDQGVSQQYLRLANLCLTAQDQIDKTGILHEAIFGFHQLFQKVGELLARYPYLENFEQSLQFYRELLPDLSIDLRGEPLKGMQIMGWLETRCLDFKNLNILSLNEGVLPKGKSDSSLLPFEVKRKFRLPTYFEKDAVYAYHFYRIMQRAEHINLFYSTSESTVGVVEPSRFIRQLELEWSLKNRAVNFSSLNATGFGNPQNKPEQISKSPAVLARLEELSQRGFSPSTLYIYLKDPLQFYYEKVLGLKPEDDLMEELDLPAQGKVIHEFLEYGFSIVDPENPGNRLARTPDLNDPFFNQPLTNIRQGLEDLMTKNNPGVPLNQGPNLLHLESMSLMLKEFLLAEKRRLQKLSDQWEVLANEENLTCIFNMNDGRKIKLHGNADRIDREGELIHIIDYKSGGQAKANYMASSAQLEAFIKHPSAIQLPVYSYMYLQSNPEATVKASILSLKKRSDNPISMQIGKNIKSLNRENEVEFAAILEALFIEMFDSTIPFTER